jgi:hypothetical protein
MSGRIEGSRRHGPFDLRGPTRQVRAATTRPTRPSVSHDDAEGLDWDGFSARYFPGARRHDMEATSAYDAYAGRLSRSSQTSTIARVV